MCFRQKPPVETKVAFLTALPKGYLLEIWKNFRSKLKRFFNLGFYWTEVSPCKCSSGYVDCKFDSLPKKPAKSLIIFASKSKTTYKFLLFDLEKNIPIKIVWSLTLQLFQTYLKLVTKNPNFSLEVGRFWWIFLWWETTNSLKKVLWTRKKEFWQPCFSFSEIQLLWFKIWKQELTFFQKYGFTSKNDFSGLDRNFVKSAGKFLLIVQDLFIRTKIILNVLFFQKLPFPKKLPWKRKLHIWDCCRKISVPKVT